MSSMSGSLSCGAMMWRIPSRCAASAFSFSPPIGRTWPVRVISPVIAVSGRTRRPVAREASAVAIVMPALGPSFGIAPAGTCTWNLRSNDSWSTPSDSACVRTAESAICADSFITSPSCPVSTRPSPGADVASTNSTSPPVALTASPVATPGTAVRSAASR